MTQSLPTVPLPLADPPAAPLRLTGTLVAAWFRFRCERQLRYSLLPESLRGGDVPARNADPALGPVVGPRPGMGLLAQAGLAFERRRLDALERRFGAAAVLSAGRDVNGNAVRLPYERVVEALRDPGTVEFLVQPELRIPDPAAFAARYGIDPALVRFAPAQADLVRIRRGRGGSVRFEVVDVKWSREPAVHHFAQVAFYALILEEMARAEGIAGRVETRWGWVWSRGPGGPRRFAMEAYRYHVERFLREVLPHAAAAHPASTAWHVSPRCGACEFFDHCRAEADRGDDVARVPGLTPLARQVLRERGMTSVSQLQRAALRKDTYTGCHALESAEGALRQRVQALRFGKTFDVERQTHLMGPAESTRVLLSAEGDPVSGICYGLGLRVESADGAERTAVFLAGAGTERAEREVLGRLLARLQAELAEAERESAGDRRAGGVHFYVYDRDELELLRGLFQRHLADAEAQPALAALARAVFPAAGQGGLRFAAAAPGTVLLDAVSELFALPVPYALDLAAVSAALRPAEDVAVHRPRADYAWPFSSQVAFERIHNVWSGRGHHVPGGVESPTEVREEIVRTIASKLAALGSVVRAVREQAGRRGTERLLLARPLGGGHAAGEPIAHPTLETLRLFTEWEAAAEALAIRALHALPTRDRARRFEAISGMERVEVSADGKQAVFEFDPACREVKFRPGEFALVLTNDDGRSLVETDRKPWLRRKLMVELVRYDLTGPRPRVVLGSEHGFDRMEREKLIDLDRVCVLDRAEADFNTRRVVATLRALAEGHGEAAFVLGLLDGNVPAEGPAPLDAEGGWRIVDEAMRRTGAPVLNAEQAAAWRAVFDRSASVIWGPPGTGKTYLLAWTLIGLAAAARAAGRPLRIGVSAATHRAIVNVLVRTAREMERAGIDPPLRLVKLVGRGSEADADLAGLPVELADDRSLPALLAEAAETGMPVVVGSTVWSLWKQMRAMNGAAAEEGDDASGELPVRPVFDVVVVDEASQVKVPDALVALSSIRRGGRVVLAGDDRQLAPIVRGRYGEEGGTLFGSAFAHFAGLLGRLTLRESRRMNRALAAYPRRTFYPGLVSMVPGRRIAIASGTVSTGETDGLLRELFFRPDDAVVLCTYGGVRASARNPFEAWLAGRIATIARSDLVDPKTGAPYEPAAFRAEGLAVISPHRAQNSAILAELLGAGWAHGELPVVDTVERMQGNEREMIVVSYAVADAEYAEREAEFLLDPNRFNVSITRARSKLVVLMSDEVLGAIPRDERVMTESMAIKGYPGHLSEADARDAELPGPDGRPVRVRIHRRRLR